LLNALTDLQRRLQLLQDADRLLKTADALLADSRIRRTRGVGRAVVRACASVPYEEPPAQKGGEL
jgi:hypothetical protein